MRKIMISIALVALMLTGCSKNEGKTTAVENIATDTVATIGDASADATTEEVVEEPAPEKETLEAEVTTEVPATTEIGGGKKKAEETTEEQKPSTTESTKPSTNHSNSGNASNGQSTTPKPSNSGSSSGNSGSSSLGNSGNSSSGNNNSNNGGSNNGNATNNTPQHQHNYNVWVKTKDAWNETVIDTPEQTIDYPEQGYYAPAKQCNTCHQVFTSSDEFRAHRISDGGWCDCSGSGTTQVWVKTRDPYTEVIPAKTHTVHHDEEGYWTCSCGARE